jgi:hypothetical protein
VGLGEGVAEGLDAAGAGAVGATAISALGDVGLDELGELLQPTNRAIGNKIKLVFKKKRIHFMGAISPKISASLCLDITSYRNILLL